MQSSRILPLLALLGAACATEESVAVRPGDPPTPARDELVQADPSVAPLPFTAEEIRAGCAPGTVLVQRIQNEGAPVVLQTTRFVSGDAQRVRMEATSVTEAGDPAGPPQVSETSWAELRDHARFPAELTARTAATCEVEAGTFECWLYTIARGTADEPRTDRLYFARAHPGPPVLFESERDGRVVFRLELTELHPPGDTD